MSLPAPATQTLPPTTTQPVGSSHNSRVSGSAAELIRIRPSLAALHVGSVASFGNVMEAAPSCRAAELLVRSMPAPNLPPPSTSMFLSMVAVVGSPAARLHRPPVASFASAYVYSTSKSSPPRVIDGDMPPTQFVSKT